MKNVAYLLAGLSLTMLAAGCKPTLDAPSPETANLDLSRYVAVGDYITAGFMNGGLSRESQQTAYPNILAQQFASASKAGAFVQPYFSNAGTPMVGLSFNEAGIPVATNTQELMNFLQAGCGSNNQTVISDQFSNSAEQTAIIQNLGVPGLKIRQMGLSGLGNDLNNGKPGTAAGAPYNSYFDRLLPAGNDQTYRDVVSNSKPTFFTIWVGMADVLQFVMSGGTCGTPPSSADFSTEMTAQLDALTANGNAKGVVCNLPSVQYLGLPKLHTLEAKYQQQQNNPDQKIWIITRRIYAAPSAGNDTVEVTEADLITYKGLERIGKNEQVMVNGNTQTLPHGLSKFNPLTDEEAFDRKEVEFLESLITTGQGLSKPSYNTIITNLITGKNSKYTANVAIANMQELYGSLFNGLNFNGVIYSLKPVTGGFYSYDFFTPTPRGQAIIANEIIQTINEKFGTTIFEVNVNSYPAFQHP